jgi:hypothetical protein
MRHALVDRKAIPLALMLTAANVHDSVVFEQMLDRVKPIRRPRGRPRKRPEKLHADIHEAFLFLGAALICLSYLQKGC